MEFEWDQEKCLANIRLRKLDFSDAAFLLDDPHALTWEDERQDYGEPR